MNLSDPAITLAIAAVALAQCLAAAIGIEVLPPGDRQRRILGRAASASAIILAGFISYRFAVALS